MSDGPSTEVECPVCGESFDPAAAGGWCTNSECGEWQYVGEEVPDPATSSESADAEASGGDAAEAVGDDGDAGDEGDAGDAGGAVEPTPAIRRIDGDATADATADATDADAGAEGPADDEATDGPTDDEGTAERTAADGAVGDGDEETCPDCGAGVSPGDNFCAECGADLEAARPAPAGDAEADEATGDESAASAPVAGDDGTAADGDAAAAGLYLRARGEEITVSDDQTVGREVRKLVTGTGGDRDDAVLIHREHVRFVHEDGQFYVVDLGDNPTVLNGRELSKGDREPVEPGDELELSGVVSLDVEAP